MSDELERLRAALKSAPPVRDAARAAALDRAMAAFDAMENTTGQESGVPPRPIPDRPQGAGLIRGVFAMLSQLGGKPALAATGSALALGLALFVVLPFSEQSTGVGLQDPQQGAEAEGDAGAVTAANPRPDAVVVPPAQRKAAPEAPLAPHADTAASDAPIALTDEMAPSPLEEAERAAPVSPDASESYANAQPNPVRVTAEAPVSTFAVDVDTASYALIRDSLNAGFLPDPQAVRIEEMVNYFPYDYPAPAAKSDAPFQASLAVMPTPWNAGTRLVRIALQGRLPAMDLRPPLNLVFLIDTSGSMQAENKLPLLRQSLALMLGSLRPEDQVAIVAYAGSAGLVLPATPASERGRILDAMDQLEAGGATAGAEGLALAYRTAAEMADEGEVSRILLATDGDFNLGLADPQGLAGYVATQRAAGIYLSVLGFGRGNLDDATMQALAQNGNGTASYIDTLQEARKVLVDQLTGTLFPIADDVKIQVEWNPAEVAEYRLIGYETRALRREDFNNDRVDAGEIGAGHQVTALYEVTAPGSPALLHDPLRYGVGAADSVAPVTTEGAAELGFLRLRFKEPGTTQSALIELPIPSDAPVDAEANFAAAVAGFGGLLQGSTYLGAWGWDAVIALADANRGPDPFGYRVEAINLMRLARDLSR